MNNYIKGYMYKEANEITIQSGDTLSRLANSHNTTVDELVSLNNIKDPNVIRAGQRLRLPGAQPAPQVTPQVTPKPKQAINTSNWVYDERYPDLVRREGESTDEYSRRRLFIREGVYPAGHNPSTMGSVYKDSRGYDTLPFGIKYTDEVRNYLINERGLPDPRRHAIEDVNILKPLAERNYNRALENARTFYNPIYGERNKDRLHGVASMIYQLGFDGAKKFSNYREALNRGDTDTAILELYRGKQQDDGSYPPSKWSVQTPKRVLDQEHILRNTQSLYE